MRRTILLLGSMALVGALSAALLLISGLGLQAAEAQATTPSSGTVTAWGYNPYHQSSVPANLSGVTAISAGVDHSLALKDDGTVVAWGDNAFDQTNVPADLSGVTAISAGAFHSLALKDDGTVVAWGNNSYGQSSVPADLSSVTAISAGYYDNLALVVDTTAPTVTTWSPTPTASKKATVTATFSEDVQNVETTTFKLERVIAVKKVPTKYEPVAATVSPSSGIVEKDQKATLTPTLDLPNGVYRVTITNGVTDTAGTALVPKTWGFKVSK